MQLSPRQVALCNQILQPGLSMKRAGALSDELARLGIAAVLEPRPDGTVIVQIPSLGKQTVGSGQPQQRAVRTRSRVPDDAYRG